MLENTRVFEAEQALQCGFATGLRPQSDWPQIVNEAAMTAVSLPAQAQRAMLGRTVTDTRDVDLAALVRSVAGPGLRDRIVEFIDESKAR